MLLWVPLVIVMSLMLAVVVYLGTSLLGSLHRSVQRPRTDLASPWKNFGLPGATCALFLAGWVGRGLARWGEFKAEHAKAGQHAGIDAFAADLSSHILADWHAELLPVLSFVVMATLLVYHGATRSRGALGPVMSSR